MKKSFEIRLHLLIILLNIRLQNLQTKHIIFLPEHLTYQIKYEQVNNAKLFPSEKNNFHFTAICHQKSSKFPNALTRHQDKYSMQCPKEVKGKGFKHLSLLQRDTKGFH